jgi:polysaccharide deacetylase family protein (PEP-CTERM system associated)
MNTSLSAAPLIRHIFTVDVEDYFQVEAFADRVPRSTWNKYSCRVVGNMQRILDLLEQHKTKATFFFVGWIAERFPELVRQVAALGHELGCHSYWHRTVYSLCPEEFRNDTRLAKQVIEGAAGVPVLGYRAPSWSITKACLWALDILAEEGFRYDSSIYPIHHDLYGVPNAQRFLYVHPCAGGRMLPEYPPTTLRLFGLNLPAAGGGYLRIAPMAYTRWTFRQFERKYRKQVVLYLHPWEIDPDQPRLAGKLRSQFRHYTNLGRTEERLRWLLRNYSFQPFRDALADVSQQGQRPLPGLLAANAQAAVGGS